MKNLCLNFLFGLLFTVGAGTPILGIAFFFIWYPKILIGLVLVVLLIGMGASIRK